MEKSGEQYSEPIVKWKRFLPDYDEAKSESNSFDSVVIFMIDESIDL